MNKPDTSDGSTPLFVAASRGQKAAVELLLAANADVNRPRGDDGTTPLMMAAHNGHSAIVDILLKSGADPTKTNTRRGFELYQYDLPPFHELMRLYIDSTVHEVRANQIVVI